MPQTVLKEPVRCYMPAKAQHVLSQPSRYKVLYGGRGSGKSFAFANALIVKALSGKFRLLCCREYQSSIRDSVYRLICDRIYALKLGAFFTVQKDLIYSLSGSEIFFKGLHQNISEIKSMENVSVAWCEEAEKILRDSFDVLLPTIRAPGSEIWLSFNPEDERSYIYTNFVLSSLPDTRISKLNWDDNELFPGVLRKEMEWCKINDQEKFNYIWSGFPKKYGQAVIFKEKLRVEEFEPPAGDAVFYYGADFGFGSDPTCLVRSFIRDRKLYIDKEFFGYGIEIDDLPKCWDTVPGSRNWTIRADCSRPDTISYMANHGFNCVPCEKGAGTIVDGIEFLKNFQSIIISPECKGSAEDFGNYRWKVDHVTDEVLPVPVDKSNHAVDALRYALEPWMKSHVSMFDLDYRAIDKSPLGDMLAGRNR